MSFEQLLSENYGIHSEGTIIVDGTKGYKKGQYAYFIISAVNKEIIHMEQATLAYFLTGKFTDYIAIPIPNVQGEWFTTMDEITYIVLQLRMNDLENVNAEGEILARFHQIGTTYSYEPQTVSSYGQWGKLWIDKLSYYERKTETLYSRKYSEWNERVSDALPYIIGISENAIQYMQETEKELRFHENDQGSITFNRYKDHLAKPFLWSTDLVYDHPVRDVAEKIRHMIIDKHDYKEIYQFLASYQEIRPLSIFSWRLLYARLLYPIHIFDCMDIGFTSENPDNHARDLQKLLEDQEQYEHFIKSFYQNVGLDPKTTNLPVLHWL